MKKWFLAILLLCSTVLGVKSQIIITSDLFKKLPFLIGLEGGVNFSSLQLENSNTADNIETSKYKPGLKLGLNFLFQLNYDWDFETGIYYMNAGQKKTFYYVHDVTKIVSPWQSISDSISYTNQGDENYNLNYLYIPLKVNYNFKSFFVSAGTYLSVLTDGDYNITRTSRRLSSGAFMSNYEYHENVSLGNSNKFNLGYYTKSYSTIDFGLNVGGGCRFSRFIIKSSFDLGLHNVVQYSAAPNVVLTGMKTKLKNRFISVSLTYLLSNNHK